MENAVFIVQGEGRGHLSQAVALKEFLDEAGIEIAAVYTSCPPGKSLPDYYTRAMGEKQHTFESPWFLRTPNRKGIYIGRTLLFNLARSARYFRSIAFLRRELRALEPDYILNFYELVGALAMRGAGLPGKRIGVGHHFLLHLEGYSCGKGNRWHRLLLSWHSRLVLSACDRVLALSFRETAGRGKIRVVPPLVRKAFREASWQAGERRLVYLLNEGFISDLVKVAENHPEFRADVFSSLPPDTPMPAGIRLHAFDDRDFIECMRQCRSLISTAGFDTIAEAASMGIPLVVVPSQNHFEQRCNAVDIEGSGIGRAFGEMSESAILFHPGQPDPAFGTWIEGAGEIIIKLIRE